MTKRFDSMVRSIGAGVGVDLVDLAVAVLPEPQAAFGPGQPESLPWPGVGIVATTLPLAASILSMRPSTT